MNLLTLAGLVGWIIFLPVQIDLLREHLGFRLAVSDLFIPLMVLSVLAIGYLKVPRGVILYTAALVSIFLISTYVAIVKTGSLSQYALVNKNLGLLLLVLCFFLIIWLVRSREDVLKLMKWLLLSAFVWNAISLIGYAVELLLGIPTPFLEFENRLTGPLIDPNAYGGYLVLIFLLQLSLLIKKRCFLSLWLMWLNAFLLLIGIILTNSRSAWLGLIFGALILLWFYKGKFVFKIVQYAVGAAMLMWLVLGPTFIEQIIVTVLRVVQIETRWELIQLGLSSFANSPLLGIGLGVFPLLSGGQIIHNTYVWVLVEMGIIGFIVLMAFLCRAGLNYWAAIKYLPEERALVVGLFAGYIAMLGLAVGIEALYQRHWWLLVALSEVLYRFVRLKTKEKAGFVYGKHAST